MPAFDILRVEKDGSTVIAGRAELGAIEIVDGDKVIASPTPTSPVISPPCSTSRRRRATD